MINIIKEKSMNIYKYYLFMMNIIKEKIMNMPETEKQETRMILKVLPSEFNSNEWHIMQPTKHNLLANIGKTVDQVRLQLKTDPPIPKTCISPWLQKRVSVLGQCNK